MMNSSEKDKISLFELLKIQVLSKSEDYVNNEKQYHLHGLLTEQRHLKTWNLSSTIKTNTLLGVKEIMSVDQDISDKLEELCKEPSLIYQASKAVEEAILNRKKIYIYGCGATGRLAKQIEIGFWKPFWNKLKSNSVIWSSILKYFNEYDIENALIGEITGSDRALISSLEGFEDLQVIGKLQLKDHGIQLGDLVFAVTEGGETSSVIGTILEASNLYENKMKEPEKNLYFIYNNPNEVLMLLDRSRRVIENNNITKISLSTGPQAITGSTRLQATTISTFFIGILIEHALSNILKVFLLDEQRFSLGFGDLSLEEKLLSFLKIQQSIHHISSSLGSLVDLESSCYKNGNFSTYFAKSALITVFTDATERSPTFNLNPLDSVKENERKSWIQIWTSASNQQDAWKELLGRSFNGLDENIYKEHFLKIENFYLKDAAIRSLSNAGSNQQFLYDFSFSKFNIEKNGPTAGDLIVSVLLFEEINEILSDDSRLSTVLGLFANNKAKLALILVVSKHLDENDEVFKKIISISSDTLVIQLLIDVKNDPLKIRQQIGIKMLLNIHSTCLMAKLDRVVGNTMTFVKPGNLKLVGRATYLIQMHVNHVLERVEWNKEKKLKINYREANAILFDCLEYTGKQERTQTSEVSLCIIRILEAFKRESFISWEDAKQILRVQDLESFLIEI